MHRSRTQIATSYAPGALFTYEGGLGCCVSVPISTPYTASSPAVQKQLFEHLHEPAEREQADAVLGLAPAQAQDLRPKADREGQDLNPEDLRPHEVPELMHEDEHRAQDGEVEEIHVRPTFYARRSLSAIRPRPAPRASCPRRQGFP